MNLKFLKTIGIVFLGVNLTFVTWAKQQYEVSILTVKSGDEIYASFGHVGIKIADSIAHTNVVYNYGNFDGFEKNFEWKFTKGNLLYSVGKEGFKSFMYTYKNIEKRSVHEQKLKLNDTQATQIINYLEHNLKPENSHYYYDFLYDNCATRIRDIFPKIFGNRFQFGKIKSLAKLPTARQIINHYLVNLDWERAGINLLLGSKMDVKMNENALMFLPDYLSESLAGATLDHQPIAEAVNPLLVIPVAVSNNSKINSAFLFFSLLPLLLIFAMVFKKEKLFSILSNFFFLILGLLGCLIIFMWYGTTHSQCTQNYNLIWCNPLLLIFPFISAKIKRKYALLGLFSLFFIFLISLLKIQNMLQFSFIPIYLFLLIVYTKTLKS